MDTHDDQPTGDCSCSSREVDADTGNVLHYIDCSVWDTDPTE